VSRARFESKLMQASTAYRMTVYRHQIIRPDRASSQLPSGKTESALSLGLVLQVVGTKSVQCVPSCDKPQSCPSSLILINGPQRS